MVLLRAVVPLVLLLVLGRETEVMLGEAEGIGHGAAAGVGFRS